MQENIHYLYKITNLVNGKLYIGVTTNPTKRKLQHFTKSKVGRLVNKAVEKYGKDNFTFEVICIGSKEYIYDLESKAILSYNSDANEGHGYNLCIGGMINNQVNKGKSISKRSDDKPVYVSGFWFPNKRTSLKALNWGEGMFNFRKKEKVLGKISYSKKRYGPQQFVYAAGFWFPSKKVVIKSLDISPSVYEKRRIEGSLGDLISPERKSNSTALGVPNYFKGFWFPSLYTASEIFNMRPETIRQRILRGSFEEKSGKTKTKTVRQYLVKGVVFSSLQEASDHFNIPYTTVKNRVSKKLPDYGYTYIIKEY